jgi:hypothetical protein
LPKIFIEVSLKLYNTKSIRSIKRALSEYACEYVDEQHPIQALTMLKEQEVQIERKHISSSHFSCSAILLNPVRTKTVLIWHEKLKMWLQPGGHIEIAQDQHLHETATRELLEEVVFESEEPILLSKVPFDFDIHEIGSERCIKHLDFRFGFECEEQAVRSTSTQKWFDLHDLILNCDPSISRFCKKAMIQKYLRKNND